ncbi:MAG: methylaspartate mutase [Proteobacteria bacterium]|nr:methylaspartate mutase [Pseudomonadota bacterium]
MKPDEANVIVITDCGSTTTKAILIEKRDGVFRQTYRGDAPTTVEAPVEDVTQGVVAAFNDLAVQCGRRITDEQGEIIRPSEDGTGVDLYLSTSSAGGGLQMMVAGLVRRISVESAERAALGAGAIVADVIAFDDERPWHGQIDSVRKLRPDMVLLAGGTDGGADVQVVEMAELLAAADPRPRFGKEYRLPVIFAGNTEISGDIRDVLTDACDLYEVGNIRPTVDHEQLGPAREQIHNLFLDHVMRQAPGFGNLVDWTDGSVVPTPSAVGNLLHTVAKERNISILAVDIGGATTDLFSVIDETFTRTVSANLGLSYSATNVLQECGIDNLKRWLPFAIDERPLRDQVMNKTIRPTTIPDSVEDLLIEQAIAREALRLSYVQHRAFATGLKGGRQSGDVDRAFSSGMDNTHITPMQIDLIIGSGGVLSHAPRLAQTAAMLIDAFLPEGVTQLAKDSIFMMPHLGALLDVVPAAARAVFEQDCLKELGTCVAPVGKGRLGARCLEYRLVCGGDQIEKGWLLFGEVKVVHLEEGAQATLHVMPTRRFDVGSGMGKSWTGNVTGSQVGIILDGRGRPLNSVEDPRERIREMEGWLRVLGAIDSGGGAS